MSDKQEDIVQHQAGLPQGRSAFLFPGAGVETLAEDARFHLDHRTVIRPLLDEASDRIGSDLIAAASGDGMDRLGPLAQQVLTYAFGVGVARVVESGAGPASFTAGHSLGVYGAVVAAGSMSFLDGLEVLIEAYRLAEDSCRGRAGATLAVAGLTESDVLRILEHADTSGARKVISNHGWLSVVSGHLNAVEAFHRRSEVEGAARLVWLDSKIAWHNPEVLTGVSDLLSRFIGTVGINDPLIPVVSTIDARVLRTASDVADLLGRNIATPIRWDSALAVLSEAGVASAYECGPGDTLTRMARFVEGAPTHWPVRRLVRRGLI
jgi:[acyl-carrier-protein] S-malonyltransferase